MAAGSRERVGRHSVSFPTDRRDLRVVGPHQAQRGLVARLNLGGRLNLQRADGSTQTRRRELQIGLLRA
jgi:hypothetical protein